jgi:hypothetical protein
MSSKKKAKDPKVLELYPDKHARDMISRWGGNKEVFAKGFVSVPTLFLEARASLKPHVLNPAETMFVIDLMSHKWDARSPFPGYKRLAKMMGCSEQYVRKIARTLENKQFIKRIARVGATNEFDLSPLFAKLTKYAAEQSKLAAAKPASRRVRTAT